MPADHGAAGRGVFRAEVAPWIEPPGHFGGFSRMLVSPDSHDTERFDFRVSRYEVGGFVEPHTHEVAEHVYYFTAGSGVLGYGDAMHSIEPGMVAFIPAGVLHSVRNTGDTALEFVIVTAPPDDISRDQRTE